MASGMAVLEVNLPSGYYVQQQKLDSYVRYARVRNLREARYQETKVEVYFDYVSTHYSAISTQAVYSHAFLG